MKAFFQKGFILLLILAMLLPCLVACGDKDEIEFQDLTWAVGAPLPEAEDFVVNLPEGAEASFAKDYEFPEVGDYTLTVIVKPKKGGKIKKKVKFSLIVDKVAPTFTEVNDVQAYIGDGIAYRAGVTVTDNCGGDIQITVDDSKVDKLCEGEYPIVYTAIDAAGNRATAKATLYLYDERVTEADLYAALDPIIAKYIPTSGSKQQQAKEVYNYVYNHISYTATSDKNDWVRAAYNGLKKGEGDCYTYFALSKAFFTRLGIENMDIQRTKGLIDERHYWNLVNIGTQSAPQWYHFDATPLLGATHSGCLLTDAQVQNYTKQRVDDSGAKNYFYAYDTSAYPKSATAVITSGLGY